MLKMFKDALGSKAQKFSGKTDFLEAVCAASALVAAADGDISDDELKSAMSAVKANAILSAGFDVRTIETTMDKMCSRAVGRVGKAGLKQEIREAASRDPDMGETVLLVALDVADSGGISDAETKVLTEIAQEVGLDLQRYL